MCRRARRTTKVCEAGAAAPARRRTRIRVEADDVLISDAHVAAEVIVGPRDEPRGGRADARAHGVGRGRVADARGRVARGPLIKKTVHEDARVRDARRHHGVEGRDLVRHEVRVVHVGRACARAKRLLPHGDAVLIAEIEPALALRIMRAAHPVRVEAEQHVHVRPLLRRRDSGTGIQPQRVTVVAEQLVRDVVDRDARRLGVDADDADARADGDGVIARALLDSDCEEARVAGRPRAPRLRHGHGGKHGDAVNHRHLDGRAERGAAAGAGEGAERAGARAS